MAQEVKFCPECGKEVSDNAVVCPNCGVQIKSSHSGKSRLVAALLAFFLGAFGVHWFYIGKKVYGIIMLIASILLPVLFIVIFIATEYAIYSNGSDAGIIIMGNIVIFTVLLYLALLVVSFINGIMFLMQSDEEFQKKYCNNK